MAELFTPSSLAALLTLAALEIVLGIDNIVFIAVVTARLEKRVQARARQIGLLAAMGTRVALLFCIKWIMGLGGDLFSVAGHAVSGKDLILLGGGFFLLAKATWEIHHKLEVPRAEDDSGATPKAASFGAAIAQIAMIDVVFSLDSVITAVGIADQIAVMVIAIVLAIIVMMIFANPVSDFIERHPTMKMLALAFLLLIGVMLMAEGFGQHLDRKYIYVAMGFSLFVELLNMRMRRNRTQRRLNVPRLPDGEDGESEGLRI